MTLIMLMMVGSCLVFVLGETLRTDLRLGWLQVQFSGSVYGMCSTWHDRWCYIMVGVSITLLTQYWMR